MDFNAFKNLVQNTRSTRRFKPNITIDSKELTEVIDVARSVSSARNMQPLKYLIVTNKGMLEQLSSTSKWATHLTQWSQSQEEQPSAFIIVCNDTSIEGYEQVDCGIALQTIMLGLKIKGYDSCPLASIDKEICQELFHLDTHLKPILGIAIGISDETINIVDIKNDTNYYRDEKDHHCVPKRTLETILLGQY